MLSCLRIRCKRLSIVVHSHVFMIRLFKDKVLFWLLINEILDSLVTVHCIKILFLWFLKTDPWVDWWSCFDISFLRVHYPSCHLVFRVLRTNVWIARFNWDDFVWGCGKKLIPIFVHVVSCCKFFIINSFKILNLWSLCFVLLALSMF